MLRGAMGATTPSRNSAAKSRPRPGQKAVDLVLKRAGRARIGLGLEVGYEPKSLDIAQYASVPLIIALVLALVLQSS